LDIFDEADQCLTMPWFWFLPHNDHTKKSCFSYSPPWFILSGVCTARGFENTFNLENPFAQSDAVIGWKVSMPVNSSGGQSLLETLAGHDGVRVVKPEGGRHCLPTLETLGGSHAPAPYF
jgi:hypothetical protein